MRYTTIEALAETQGLRQKDGELPFVRAGTSYKRYLAKSDSANSLATDVLTQESLGHHALNEAAFAHLALDITDRQGARLEKFMAVGGDIVVSLSPPFRAIYVEPCFAGVLVPSGMAIIHADEMIQQSIDMRFLAGWLSSKLVREQLLPDLLNATRVGVQQRARRSLTVENLLDVAIPAPDMEEQIRLGELVAEAAQAERRRWRQQTAEDESIELHYWKTCMAEENGTGTVMENDERIDQASSANATDAIRNAQTTYTTGNDGMEDDGWDASLDEEGRSTGGQQRQERQQRPQTYQQGQTPRQTQQVQQGGRMQRQRQQSYSPNQSPSAASRIAGLAQRVVDAKSQSRYRYELLAKRYTPDYYEATMRDSQEASQGFLDALRAMSGEDTSPTAPPGGATSAATGWEAAARPAVGFSAPPGNPNPAKKSGNVDDVGVL